MRQIAKFLVVFLLFFQCSCTESRKSKVNINNQGVLINYNDSKTGDTVLLFIHGWGINQTYWANQVSFFSKRFRVVTLDLPGFGKSGKNRKTWTVKDYSEDIHAILTQLDLKNVILIGHSMSGSIIVETALNYPSPIIGVIGIDNFKDIGTILTPELEKEWAAFYTNARNDFKRTVSKDIYNLFAPSTDSLIQKRVSEDILSSDTLVAVTCLENLDKYPFTEKLKTLNKPLFLINSDYTPTDTLAFQKKGIGYRLLNMGTTGHYPMIEKPVRFNLLLQEAIDGIRKNK